MSIAALALDRYADSTSSVAVKENNIGVDEICLTSMKWC